MKHVIATAGVLLASSLSAQVYIPSQSIGNSESGYYGYYFGGYPGSRHQMCDGNFGSATKVLKSMSLRLDQRSHSTSTAQGRSWTDVQINMSKGDLATFSTTFATNQADTPTMVFSGSATWNTQSGFPANSPAAWGSNGQSFTFGTPYIYLGNHDVLIDTVFTGGTLANNQAWATSTLKTYYNDAENGTNSTSSGIGRYVPQTRLNNTSPGVVRCNDSAMTTSTGAYTFMTLTAYGSDYSVQNYRNNILFYTYSYYCGYDNPVLQGIGFNTLEPGIDLSTGCNRLHVGGPLIIYGYKTFPKSVNTSGYTGYQFFIIPYLSSYAGLQPIVQGAYTDSTTGKMQLTQSYERTILAPPQGKNRLATYNYNSASATGSLTPNVSGIYNPNLCFGE